MVELWTNPYQPPVVSPVVTLTDGQWLALSENTYGAAAVFPGGWGTYPELADDLAWLATAKPGNSYNQFAPKGDYKARGIDDLPNGWTFDWAYYDRLDSIFARLHALNRWDLLPGLYADVWKRASVQLGDEEFSTFEKNQHWSKQVSSGSGLAYPGIVNPARIEELQATFSDVEKQTQWLHVAQQQAGCGKPVPDWLWWSIPYPFGWWVVGPGGVFTNPQLVFASEWQGVHLAPIEINLQGCSENQALFDLAFATVVGIGAGAVVGDVAAGVTEELDVELELLTDTAKQTATEIALGGDVSDALLGAVGDIGDPIVTGLLDNLGISDTLDQLVTASDQLGTIASNLDQLGSSTVDPLPFNPGPPPPPATPALGPPTAASAQQHSLALVAGVALVAFLIFWK